MRLRPLCRAAERLPFTAPRTTNERSWLYRIQPTVAHWGKFRKADIGLWRTAPAAEVEMPIAPLRWDPIPIPKESLSFVEGVHTITTAGDAGSSAGMGAHVYIITRSMTDEYFYNADGEMLIVPQQGELRLCTEFGIIDVEPGEIGDDPARRQNPGRTEQRPGARLYLRELRRGFLAAGAWADRRELPGQSARFPDPGRGL